MDQRGTLEPEPVFNWHSAIACSSRDYPGDLLLRRAAFDCGFDT